MTSMNPLTGEQDKIGNQSETKGLVVADSKVRRPSGMNRARSWISAWGVGLMFLAAGTFPAAGASLNTTYQDALTNASWIFSNGSWITSLPTDDHLLTSSDATTFTIGGTNYLDVITLMSFSSWTTYYQSSVGGLKTNPKYVESWVTFEPELKNYLTDRTSELSLLSSVYPNNNLLSNFTMRAEMALGMSNSATHTMVVEFGVQADAIFRPAINWSLTSTNTYTSWDGHNDLTNGPSWYTGTYNESYRQWFENRQATIYTNSNPMPWSGLGYSYDWYYPTNTSTNIGLSEFVLTGGQSFYVVGATQLDQYLIPEPGTAWLVLAGSGVIFFIYRRNRVAHRSE